MSKIKLIVFLKALLLAGMVNAGWEKVDYSVNTYAYKVKTMTTGLWFDFARQTCLENRGKNQFRYTDSIKECQLNQQVEQLFNGPATQLFVRKSNTFREALNVLESSFLHSPTPAFLVNPTDTQLPNLMINGIVACSARICENQISGLFVRSIERNHRNGVKETLNYSVVDYVGQTELENFWLRSGGILPWMKRYVFMHGARINNVSDRQFNLRELMNARSSTLEIEQY